MKEAIAAYDLPDRHIELLSAMSDIHGRAGFAAMKITSKNFVRKQNGILKASMILAILIKIIFVNCKKTNRRLFWTSAAGFPAA
jgi:hypothetical protein